MTAVRFLLGVAILAVFGHDSETLRADEPAATFFRGVNLNGPAVVIDGNSWKGEGEGDVESRDMAFESQDVALVPSTDLARAGMIRSSRWGGNVSITLRKIPEGVYQVFLYVWEDNNAETFDLRLNSREMLHAFSSGKAGSWRKLGPWRVSLDAKGDDNAIAITTQGGAANLSGVEIWKGGGAITVAKPSADPVAAKLFDEQVAPILSRHCLECHSKTIHKGGLNLATEATARAGGDVGEVIERGKPEESILWEQIESGEMPRGRPPMTDAEKETIRRWIAAGAKWGTPEIDLLATTTDRRAGYNWWSLRPVQASTPPDVKHTEWARNDIDRFILATLEAKGISPSPEADRRTLIRRVSFDLTGLPPDPDEVERFVADPDERAYEKLVDRLLDSSQYGERWARHWLDVVRFGESQGYERNRIRSNAWRYRDWVIDAFNRDLPYDEFIRLQIAGDLIKPGDYEALIATGYHVCGTWDQVAHNEGSESMKQATRWDELEDLVGALGQAYLGLTIQCARCHDHKFDPVSQKEYYQLAALLGGVNQEEQERKDLDVKASESANFKGVAHVIIPKQPPIYSVLDRGDYHNPLEAVAPAAPKAIAGLSGDFGLAPDAPEGERRIALAKWLSDSRNPLPARVMVNRLWHYHYGRGLVDTPSDFGFNGGRPSHPELLDWLATRFVESEWKQKPIHRLIVTSSTYRQASQARNGTAEGMDADNRLLWQANRRRLEGEALRDSVLAVSGALNRQVGGPSYRDVKVDLGNNHEFSVPTDEFSDATNRRTIYRLWARSGNHPMLESLDCPDPSVMSPRRPTTITPVQSLTMMNDRFMEQCAERFADRVRHEAGDDPGRQIDRAWHLAFARNPSDREQTIAREFLGKRGLNQLCLVLFNANEFLFVN